MNASFLSIIRWRECTKAGIVGLRPLLLALLCVRQPAVEKSKVITYKELK